MKIKGAKIDWMIGYINDPKLILEIDEIPSDLKYKRVNNFYFAEKDGYVSFFYVKHNDKSGYAGRHFNIILEDGTEEVLKGPWSVYSGVINKIPEFIKCMEVVLDTGEKFIKYSGAVTIDTAIKAVEKFIPESTVIRNPFDELAYIVALKDGRLKPTDDSKRWKDENK